MKLRPVKRDFEVKASPQTEIVPGAIFRLSNPRSSHHGKLVLIHDLHPAFPERQPLMDIVRAEYLKTEYGYRDDCLIWTEKRHLEPAASSEISIVFQAWLNDTPP